MLSLFPTFFKMQFRTDYNKTVYHLQKTPFIGDFISDKWYRSNGPKSWLSSVWYLVFILLSLLKKTVFFGSIYVISMVIPLVIESVTLSTLDVFSTLVIINTVLTGTVVKSLFISPMSEHELISIKIFHMPPKQFYLSRFFYDYSYYFVFNSLILGVLFYFSGISVLYAPLLIAYIICIRFFSSAVALQFYKWGLNPNNDFWTWVMILSTVVLGFASVGLTALNWAIPIDSLTSLWLLPFSLLLVTLGLMGWKNGNQINSIAYRSLSFESLETHLKVVETIHSSGVSLEETDYQSIRNAERIKEKQGIAYLNALFFERTRHHIKKHILRRTITAAVIITAVLIAYVFVGEFIPDSRNFLYVVGFASIIGSQYLYYSEEFSKFCFYNLDRKLMKYRFYREPDIVMTSIKIRFLKALTFNLPVLLIFMSGTIMIYFFTNEIALWALLLSLGFQLILMVFFSLNYLILYYLIQPYTVALKAKSPVYTTINFVFLSLFFVILYSDIQAMPVIIMSMSVFITLYLPLGLLAVYKYAPRQFKLRQ